MKLSEALHSKNDNDLIQSEKNEIADRSAEHESLKPVQEPDDEYTDSSTFLKGTNSQNPHNDYCQNFIDTGQVSFLTRDTFFWGGQDKLEYLGVIITRKK